MVLAEVGIDSGEPELMEVHNIRQALAPSRGVWVLCHEALMYFGLLPYPHEWPHAPRSATQRRCTSGTEPHPDSG